ncbi:MAG: hypothetical protein JNL01_09470 [Bdellovibrionales bacterium]|nr:hypothetical protein [Bdellovibrionales bacterium]
MNRNKKQLESLGQFLALGALSVGIASCSPSMLSGNGEDKSVSQQTSYRPSNTQCAGLKMSTSQLDPQTARAMVKCLNSNHKIDAYENLLATLSDQDLKPILKIANETVLGSPETIYDFKKSFTTLVDQGKADSVFKQMGVVFKNDELIAASLDMIKKVDTRLLIGLENLGAYLNEKRVERLLNFGLNVASAPAFSDLPLKFAAKSLAERKIETMTEKVMALIQSPAVQKSVGGSSHRVRLGKEWLKATADGRVFKMLEQAIPLVQASVPKLESVMNHLGETTPQGDAASFTWMTKTMALANAPVSCMKGQATLPNAGTFILKELSRQNPAESGIYLTQEIPLKVVSLAPFCTMPEGLAETCRTWANMTGPTNVMPAMTEVVRAVEQNGLSELLVQTMGYEKIQDVAGVIAELTDRQAWSDILLLSTSINDSEKREIEAFASFLLKPIADAGGDSLYEIMEEGLQKLELKSAIRLVLAIQKVVESKDSWIKPTLDAIRLVYLSTNRHPIFAEVQKTLIHARDNEALISVLVKISGSPAFLDTIRLTSSLLESGEMKNLLGATFALFDKFSERSSRKDLVGVEVPDWVHSRKHSIRSADLRKIKIERNPEIVEVSDRCSSYRMTDSILDMAPASLKMFITNIAGCAGATSKTSFLTALDQKRSVDSARAVQFLTRGPYPMIDVTVGLANDFILRAGTQGTDKWFGAKITQLLRDGILDSVTDSIHRMVTESNLVPTSIELAQATARAPVGFKDTLLGVGKLLRGPDVWNVAKYLFDLWKKEKKNPSEPRAATAGVPKPFEPALRAEVEDQLRRWECVTDAATLAKRVAEVEKEYADSLNSWETGRTKYENADAFLAEVEPILKKVSDPKQQVANKTLAQALTRFMSYFTLPLDSRYEVGPNDPRRNQNQHFTAEYMAKFLIERANDRRALAYFYPGEKKPRVRVVNGLDMMELVLYVADFQYLLPKNFGMGFLAEIGQAWGDEDRAIWPKEIQEQFDGRKKPDTLAQAVDGIKKTLKNFEGMVGYPKIDSCVDEDIKIKKPLAGKLLPLFVRASLFNSRQVIDSLAENLPDSGHAFAGGLKVIRDMAFEIYMTTPEKHRNPRSGEKNNLTMVSNMVRLGFMRNIGRQLDGAFQLSSDPKAYKNVDRSKFAGSFVQAVRGLVNLSKTPSAAPALAGIFANPDLIRKAIRQVHASTEGNRASIGYHLLTYLSEAGDLEPSIQSSAILLNQHPKIVSNLMDDLSSVLSNTDVEKALRVSYETFGDSYFDSLKKMNGQFFFAGSKTAERVQLLAESEPSIRKLIKDWKPIPAPWAEDVVEFVLDPASPEARTVREFAAGIFPAKDSVVSPAEKMVGQIAKNPTESRFFYDWLVQESAQGGALDEMLQMAKRGLTQ